MIFRIADTFTKSLGNLGAEDQKQAKTTAFDLQTNPASPGQQYHRLERAKDRNFWSVRASRDLRIIVHRSEGNLLLCYVDHHDGAYRWAERRRIETHPRTGAAQIIELRESVREIVVPQYAAGDTAKPPLHGVGKEDLLACGVPEEWTDDLLSADEDTILAIAERLPQEASEAVLNLAAGNPPEPPSALPARKGPVSIQGFQNGDVAKPPSAAPTEMDPFDHPDARRRFRIMENREELERALSAPWEQWAVFLHPAQRSIVRGTYNGPFRVSGSAGTGKTIVALHRAVHLAAEHTDSRILLTTFSPSLAELLEEKLRILLYNRPRLRDQIEVSALDDYIVRVHGRLFGPSLLVNQDDLAFLIDKARSEDANCPFGDAFLLAEWNDLIDERQISSWEEYRDAQRLGRRRRLSEAQRRSVWPVLEKVNRQLAADRKITHARMYAELEVRYKETRRFPFDYVIVDEAQDISIPALRFLSSFAEPDSQALFFAGDLGQRIFRQPFSWSALGVDIRGRSHVLRVNYRTSHQIRQNADCLLDATIRDADGNSEDRRRTVSVFNGAHPSIRIAKDIRDEIGIVARWLRERRENGIEPREIGLIVRSDAQISRGHEVLAEAGVPYRILGEGDGGDGQALPPGTRGSSDYRIVSGDGAGGGSVTLATMHSAKGLEFRAAAVMACDDNVVPSAERLDAVGDDSALEGVYVTERHLLYVACTRARDYLLVSGVEPGSEFLGDFLGGDCVGE